MSWLAAALCVALVLPLQAQNLALELDGDGDYVELPAGIFDDLTEATVEGWVRWDTIGPWVPFFSFGRADYNMGMNQFGRDITPQFFILQEQRSGSEIVRAPKALVRGRWIHLAGSSGRQGMRFYVNGVHVGTDPFTGSFATCPRRG